MWELKSHMQVDGIIRRAEAGGAFALVVSSGDRDAGAILVQVVTPDDCSALYGQTRDMDFKRVWETLAPRSTPIAEVNDMLRQRTRIDPDLWVVEISDRQGRHFLTEPVIG